MRSLLIKCIALLVIGLITANSAYSESFWEKAKREAAKQYEKVEEAAKETIDDLVTSDENEQKSGNTNTTTSDLNQDKNSVTTAQNNLKELGLYEGTADGIHGGNTRRAISKFEDVEGMARTGDVTQNLLTKLEAAVSQGRHYGAASNPKVAQDNTKVPQQEPPAKSPKSSPESTATPLTTTVLPAGFGIESGGTTKTGERSENSSQEKSATNYVKADNPDGGKRDWSVIPTFLLVYKYAPEKISEDSIRSMLRKLIRQDQHIFSLDEQHAQGKTALFAKEQVAGRSPDFVVDELLGEYKEILKRWADSVPDTVYIEDYKSTSYMRYQNGKLGSGAPSGQGADIFQRYSVMPDYEKKKIPELGARELSGGSSGLIGSIDSSFQSKIPGYHSVRFAYDKIPTIHAIPLPSKEAEAMFIQPDRSSCGSKHTLQSAVERSEARAAGAEALQKYEQEQQAIEKCEATVRAQIKRFKLGFKIVVELETEGFIGNTDILSLKIKGAQVYGPHGRLFKTYAGSEFAPATDVREEQLVAENQARQTELEELQGLDILGIMLGMSMKQAEQLLAKQMKFDAVYSITGAKVTTSSRNAKPSQNYKPYIKGKVFAKSDGSNVVAVFTDDSHQVIGVSRRLESKTLKRDVLRSSLEMKYGKPNIGDRKHSVWGSQGKRYSCSGGINFSTLKLTLVSGSQVQNIGYKGAGLDTYHDVTAEALSGCAPVLEVRHSSLESSGGGHAEFRLYDHSKMAAGLRVLEGEREQEEKANEEELVL